MRWHVLPQFDGVIVRWWLLPCAPEDSLDQYPPLQVTGGPSPIPIEVDVPDEVQAVHAVVIVGEGKQYTLQLTKGPWRAAARA